MMKIFLIILCLAVNSSIFGQEYLGKLSEEEAQFMYQEAMKRNDIDAVGKKYVLFALSWSLLDIDKIEYQIKTRLEDKQKREFYEELYMPIGFLKESKRDSALKILDQLLEKYSDNQVVLHHLLLMKIPDSKIINDEKFINDIEAVLSYFHDDEIKKMISEEYVEKLFENGNLEKARGKSWEFFHIYNNTFFLEKFIEICFESLDYQAIIDQSHRVQQDSMYEVYYEVGFSYLQLGKKTEAQMYFDKLFELIINTPLIYPKHRQEENVLVIIKKENYSKIELFPIRLFEMAKFYKEIDPRKSCDFLKYTLTNIEYYINKKMEGSPIVYSDLYYVKRDVFINDDWNIVDLQALKVKVAGFNLGDCNEGQR